MCIAVPAQIIELYGDGSAKVSVSGNSLNVSVKLVKADVGDYVLVHAGCAIEVVNRDAAQELTVLLGEIVGAFSDES